ncbi:MAG: hypothetical protein ACRYFS_10770 [Janthinobacterium lividum]
MRSLYLCAVALLLTGCSHPAPTAAVSWKTVGDLAVSLTVSPPAHMGDNMFSVTLADSATQLPIGNANMTAVPEMLSPQGTGSSSSGRSQGNGLYLIPIRLGIATRYDINLHIERSGKPAADVSFPVDAVQ